MTAAPESTTEHRLSPSTLRVRRHRERRREGLRLVTVEVPEPAIEAAVARGLLKPEDHAEAWAVRQGGLSSPLCRTENEPTATAESARGIVPSRVIAVSHDRQRSSSVRPPASFCAGASRYCLRRHFDLEGAIV